MALTPRLSSSSHAPPERLYAVGLLHQGCKAPLRGIALDLTILQHYLLAGGMRRWVTDGQNLHASQPKLALCVQGIFRAAREIKKPALVRVCLCSLMHAKQHYPSSCVHLATLANTQYRLSPQSACLSCKSSTRVANNSLHSRAGQFYCYTRQVYLPGYACINAMDKACEIDIFRFHMLFEVPPTCEL